MGMNGAKQSPHPVEIFLFLFLSNRKWMNKKRIRNKFKEVPSKQHENHKNINCLIFVIIKVLQFYMQ